MSRMFRDTDFPLKEYKFINKYSALVEVRGMVLECHPTILRASEELIRAVCNGCGPGSWKFDFIPDKPSWADFTWPCHFHDWDYFILNTMKGKKYADKRARSNWGTAVRTCHLPWWMPKWYQRGVRKRNVLLPHTYYLAVKNCGNGSFFETDKKIRKDNNAVRMLYEDELREIDAWGLAL